MAKMQNFHQAGIILVIVLIIQLINQAKTIICDGDPNKPKPDRYNLN
jgi:hypothetical protein